MTHAIEVRLALPGEEPLGALTIYLRLPVVFEDVLVVWRAGMAPWLTVQADAACGAVARPLPVVTIGGVSGPVTKIHTAPVIIPPVDAVSASPPIELAPHLETERSPDEAHAIARAGRQQRWRAQ